MDVWYKWDKWHFNYPWFLDTVNTILLSSSTQTLIMSLQKQTLSCFLVRSKNLLKLSLGHLTISTKIENAYLIWLKNCTFKYHSKKMISVHHYCFQREIRPECTIKSTSLKFIWLLLNIFDLIFKVNERILQFFFLSNSFLISGDFRFFFSVKLEKCFFKSWVCFIWFFRKIYFVLRTFDKLPDQNFEDHTGPLF